MLFKDFCNEAEMEKNSQIGGLYFVIVPLYMRAIFCQVLFSFWAFLSFAQSKQVTLSGIISLNTGEVFPYKVVFTESEGRIKGYSLTYNEPDETKAAVSGLLDRRMHTLSFKETDIIYSHGFQAHAFMCLIDANLEYVSGRGNILTGSITSKETDKTACTGGTILFNNDKEILNLFSYHEKFDTVISMKKKTKETYIPQPEKAASPEPRLITEKVTAGIEKTYDWHTDTVVIDVWDGGNVDGDRITLSFNGKPYFNNYFLVKEKRQLRLPISGNHVNTITIFADNEGSDPPNTASLLLTDGAIQYSVLAYNPKGRQAIIKIKRMK